MKKSQRHGRRHLPSITASGKPKARKSRGLVGGAKAAAAASLLATATLPSARAPGSSSTSQDPALPAPDTEPKHQTLAFDKQNLGSVCRAEYWRQLCPQLHVQDEGWQALSTPLDLPLRDLHESRRRINEDGYTQMTAGQLNLSVSMGDLALGVVQLMQYGWPPAFIMLYDEAWHVAHEVSEMLKAVTGNEINMDMLAWYIDPNKGHVGFSPHRDRQPEDSPSTFRSDGSAKYTTIWIPFTDATQDNSCLYVIPRQFDPGYFVGDDDADDAPDPLSVALNCKQAYQNVRALPAASGSAVIFTHRIIHWGSRGREGCTTPRISFSFGCASDDYESAYFLRANLPFPDHKLRLALACGQMIVYHERFDFSKAQLSMFHALFKMESHRFTPAYQSTVKFELIGTVKDVAKRGHTQLAPAAARPAAKGASAAAVAEASGDPGEESSDDDVMDDMMDAMLDAKMKGLDGELEDDFDDDEELQALAGRGSDDEDSVAEEEVGGPLQIRHPSLHGGLHPRMGATSLSSGGQKKPIGAKLKNKRAIGSASVAVSSHGGRPKDASKQAKGSAAGLLRSTKASAHRQGLLPAVKKGMKSKTASARPRGSLLAKLRGVPVAAGKLAKRNGKRLNR